MASEVWYRKWRPQTFLDVAGQRHVTLTLARAVEQDRVSHAYLFCGPRGTGKTSTARILAKAVNCEVKEVGQPCTRCESCRAVAEGRALDLIEMDAASNRGIDEIRGLRDKVGYSPNSSQYKVYLIDEVHELTQFAFDALLKTLEEPPPHVIFVLATTEAHKVPATITSRCQRFDFVRIKLGDVVGRLREIGSHEGIEATDAALAVIARRATGSLRDAVNLFEQTVALHGRVLSEQVVFAGMGGLADARVEAFVQATLQQRLADALNAVAAVRDDGADLRQFTRDAVQYLRSMLLVRAGASESLELGDEALNAVRDMALALSVTALLRAARLFSAVDFRADPQSSLPLELAAVEYVAGPAEPLAAVVAESERPAAARKVSGPAAAASPAPGDRLRAALTPRTAPRPDNRVAAGAATPPSAPQPVRAPQPVAMPQQVPAAATVAEPVDSSHAGTSIPTMSAAEMEEPRVAAVVLGTDSAGGEPSDPTLEQARAHFREIYERCGARDRGAARLLNSGGCDIVEVSGREIVIGFQHQRMVDLATGATYGAPLRQSVADVLGQGCTLRCVLAPDVASRLKLSAAERPSHLLDEAQKLGLTLVERF